MSKLKGYELLPDEVKKAIEYTLYWNWNLYTRYGVDKQDLMQIAALAYLEWLENFGGKQVTFKQMCTRIRNVLDKYMADIKKTSNITQITDYQTFDKEEGFGGHTEFVYSQDPEEIVMEEEVTIELLDAVSVLSEREKHIFMSVSWSETPKTMEEVGRELGITKQRVSVIHNTAMGKVREAFNKKN